jgi:hypothetical protein
MALDPLVERPDVVGADLREVAERILAREASSSREVEYMEYQWFPRCSLG